LVDVEEVSLHQLLPPDCGESPSATTTRGGSQVGKAGAGANQKVE